MVSRCRLTSCPAAAAPLCRPAKSRLPACGLPAATVSGAQPDQCLTLNRGAVFARLSTCSLWLATPAVSWWVYRPASVDFLTPADTAGEIQSKRPRRAVAGDWPEPLPQRRFQAAAGAELRADIARLGRLKTRHPRRRNQDRSPRARVAPGARNATADVELSEPVETHYATFAQARSDHGLQRIQRAIGCAFADAGFDGHFAAQIGHADRRGILRVVIRGGGQRLAGTWIAPDLRRQHPSREAAKASEDHPFAGVGVEFQRANY